MVPFTLGLLLAGIAIAMVKDVKLPPRTYAIGMFVLPMIYILFALLGGDMAAMGVEFLYGLPFFLIAFICAKRGFKGSGLLVVALWALHAAYDVYHPVLVDNAGVPGWYPAFCFAFDLVMVVYVLMLVTKMPNYDIAAGSAD